MHPGARWIGPRRIAHRGGGTLAPENTLAAIRDGMARGYRAVEFDVMLTADDVPVLMHDATFGRTVAGRGSVAGMRWAELARCDAGSWFGARFAGEPVPTYAAVMRFCRAHGIWMNVELKPAPGFEERTGRVVAASTAEFLEEVRAPSAGTVPGTEAGMLFSSFSSVALDGARAVAPQVPRGILFAAVPGDAVDIALALGCVGVHCAEGTLDAPLVARLHAAALFVLAYTVNDPVRARVLDDAGVDAIFTDRLDLLPFA